MNAVLCALALTLAPSDQAPPSSLADKNAELEKKVADLERKVLEMRLAELERKLSGGTTVPATPTVIIQQLPTPVQTVVAPVTSTVSVTVNQGGGYGGGYGGYGIGGYGIGGYGYRSGIGYVAPYYSSYAPRTIGHVHPVTTRGAVHGHRR